MGALTRDKGTGVLFLSLFVLIVHIPCYIDFPNLYVVERRMFIDFHQRLQVAQNSGKRGIREQRFHISLRVTITLGSVSFVHGLSHSLSILRGESNLPSVYVFLEVLQVFFCHLSKILG